MKAILGYTLRHTNIMSTKWGSLQTAVRRMPSNHRARTGFEYCFNGYLPSRRQEGGDFYTLAYVYV